MGTWGTGLFDNDTAADWTESLSYSADLSLIEGTIDRALATVGAYLDADLACEALAAADVVARLRGNWGERTPYSEAVDQWVESATLEAPERLVESALAAVDRVLAPDSELNELFAETEQYEEWCAVLDDLRRRISAGVQFPAQVEAQNSAVDQPTDWGKVDEGSQFPWLYLVLAYLSAWIFWIPVAQSGEDYQRSPMLMVAVLLGVSGPGLSGILATYREGGREAGRDFWRRALDLERIQPRWYLVILLLWPAMHSVARVLQVLSAGAEFDTGVQQELFQGLGSFLGLALLYLLQAGLEELGWRGYMLERLQRHWSPLRSSLVVGVAHLFWHLPLFWIVGTNQQAWGFGLDFWIYLALVPALSIWATWFYNGTWKSTLAVTLQHAVFNLSVDILTVPGPRQRSFFLLVIASALVIALLWARGQVAPRCERN